MSRSPWYYGVMKDISACHAQMDEAISLYKPIAVYGLFSGGDDSTTAVHIASRHPRFTSAVHINTGIGVEKTREFVRETCKFYGWPLREYRAKEDCGQDYRQLVLERGFPGPAHHTKMYNRLKERALRRLIKDTKGGRRSRETVLLISGVRSQESQRRMGYVERIQKENSKIWCAIIHDWSKLDCLDYMDREGVKRNEVSALIHKSGECLCGAFAKKGELRELEMWFPETARQIKALEVEVRAAGHQWGWEDVPPHTRKRKPPKDITNQMMCHSCNKANS